MEMGEVRLGEVGFIPPFKVRLQSWVKVAEAEGGGSVGASEGRAPGGARRERGLRGSRGGRAPGGPPFGGVRGSAFGPAAAPVALPGLGAGKWTGWQRPGGIGAHAPFNFFQRRGGAAGRSGPARRAPGVPGASGGSVGRVGAEHRGVRPSAGSGGPRSGRRRPPLRSPASGRGNGRAGKGRAESELMPPLIFFSGEEGRRVGRGQREPRPGGAWRERGLRGSRGGRAPGGPPFGGVRGSSFGPAAAPVALPGLGAVKWTGWQRPGGIGAHAPFNFFQRRGGAAGRSGPASRAPGVPGASGGSVGRVGAEHRGVSHSAWAGGSAFGPAAAVRGLRGDGRGR
ncbi:translation initiation factor IF-2-like [Epinephelus fuscoguttatus]|uniref:translation initiation factor IF-2-like n=1 Tax=Epinephelus fuscoguttatus TaxID=293821 RepID=UPI0020D03E00|nr:translation initiation factor IF-2-like [Epinephelus fuscoguttatus]